MKKSSITWNTVLTFLSGGLLLYVLSRLFQKKQKTQSNSSQSKGLTFSPTPTKAQLTYEEVFNWLRLKENVRYSAYPDGRDSKGNQLYSIGMGHQIQPNETYLLNRTISEQEVRDLFKKDIEKVTNDVESAVTVPLNKNQKLALVSIRYNVGPGGFRSGKLLSTLNTGNYALTAAIIPTFIVTSGGVFSLGIQNRRKSEQALFLKSV